jgi:hypothetical protein
MIRAADAEPDNQQSHSREHNSRDTPPLSADLEALVDYFNAVVQEAQTFSKGCREGETSARNNEQAAEEHPKAAETRLAALEAKKIP